MNEFNLFDGIPDDIIQKTLTNIEKNLGAVGRLNAHIINLHVNVPAQDLKQRAEQEGIWAASFHSERTAVRVINMLLQRDFDPHIREWLVNPIEDSLSLYGTFNQEIGYGCRAGEPKVYPLRTACLVLIKNIQYGWGFRVLTCYPTPDRRRQCQERN